MTIPEAGRIVGIGRRLAYASAREGSIPTVQFGRRRVVPTVKLRRMLEGEISANGDVADSASRIDP